MSSSIYKKYASNIGLSGIASAARALQNIVLLIVISKLIGSEGYGIWAQIMSTIALLMPIAILQLGVAMTRFLAAETDKRKISEGTFSVLAAATAMGILLSVLMFVLAEPFATTFLKGTDAAQLVRLSAFLVLLTTLDQVIIEYFLAFAQVKKYAIFTVIQVVIELALVFYMTYSGHGLFGAIVVLLITRSLFFLAGFYTVKREIIFTMPAFGTLKSWFAFSIPLLPFSLCFWMIGVGDRYVIGYFLDATQVGLYSAAYGLGSLIYLFYAPLNSVLFPAITHQYENNKIPEVKTIVGYTLKFFSALAIPAAFGLLILSRPLLNIMTTQEFTDAHSIIPIVAFGTVLFSASYVFADLLMLFKETKLLSVIFTGSALFNLVLNILLVPWIGIIGAAISTLVTFIIHSFVLGIFSNRRIHFDIDFIFLGKCLASSGLMSVAVWKLNPTNVWTMIISIVVGAVIYSFCLILMRGFNQREMAFLKNLVSRRALSL